MNTKTPEIINVTPFTNRNIYPKKQVDKKSLLMGISFALTILALISYYTPILHGIGMAITLAACGYSIYNLNKVKL